MVFATDFDPNDARRRQIQSQQNLPAAQAGQTARPQASVSPARQTDRLIVEAVRANRSKQAARRTESAFTQRSAEADMSAARPRPPLPQLSASAQHRTSTDRGASRIRPSASVSPLSLPDKPSLPLGLTLLNRAQHYSTIVTSLLVAGALAVYGSTVYVDKSTHTALTRLDALQGESQQLTAASEAIKQSLAEQAQQEDSGLELSEAGDVLYVTPAAPRPLQVEAEPAARPLRPIGY